MDDSTSMSLLEHMRQRKPEAWQRLVFLYGPLVDHWCRSWGVRGPDADDIKQEVFQAVSTGLASFRRDRPGDTFRGWLQVITRRKFLDLCRKKGKHTQAEGGSAANHLLRHTPDPNAGPDDDPAEEVTLLHHRALELIRSHFEERTWQAFWRCAVEEQTPADVARDLGMTAVAVRQAKSRILRRLKEELGDLLR